MEAEQPQTNFFAQASANSGVGTVLRSAREQGRHDLALIAEELHIRARYLLALEEGRFRDLPGPAYALGFVRSYAQYLGLDAPEMVRRYKEETANQARRPEAGLPSGAVEKTLPAGLMVVLAVVAAAVLYGLWYFLHSHNAGTAELVQPVPPLAESQVPPSASAPLPAPQTASATPIPAPAPAAPAKPPAAPAGSAASGFSLAPQSPAIMISPAQAETTPGEAGGGGSAASATTQASVVIPPLPVGPPSLPGPAAAPARQLVVRATGTTWVKVRDGNGAMLYSETMRRNDTYRVPNKPGLRLRVGNAKYITLLLDGKAIPGEFVVSAQKKDLILDPAKLAPSSATSASAQD